MMRIIGIAGFSGSGKTTLLIKLIPFLTAGGLRVSTVKHAHHDFDLDQPGKDSHAHRLAGATEVLVGSARRWAMIHELRAEPEPPLAALLDRLTPVDLVLVEGFKRETHPKIELRRGAVASPPLYPDDHTVVAIASDRVLPGVTIPVVGLDDIAAIAELAIRHAEPLSAIRARERSP